MKTNETFLTIDPPSGWMYGFPKAVTQEQYKQIKNLKQWCIDNGYPKEEADSYGDYFHIQINRDLSFMDNEKTTRQQAIAWWNSLPFNSSNTTISKQHFYDKYFVNGNKFTVAQNYSQLTGREIEQIWRKETQDIPEIPNDWKRAKYLANKPNQKQFKQFDESLFKAYIDKFSDEDKLKAFNILNEEFAYFSHEQMELVQKQHDEQVKFLQDRILKLSK